MINLLALVFVIILGLVRNGPRPPIPLASLFIQIPAESLIVSTTIGLILAVVLFGFAMYRKIKGNSSWLAVAILSPIAVVQLGRITWHTPGLVSPLYLYWLGFLMACIGGAVFQSVLSSFVPSLATPDEHTQRRGSNSFYRLTLGLILACSGLVYFFRLTELPLELNSFGTQAISTANRLLHHEVSWWDLILFREMTQEECGNSLPFVLWHALFQLLLGGMSIVSARTACATASLLSCWFMFRVCRELGGKNFALISTLIYAFLPLTIHNAKFDGIFGFSTLLVLIIAERLLVFCKRPSIAQGLVLGITMPLGAYGIANIRLMIVSMILACFYYFFVAKLRSWRLYALPLLAALVTIGILVLPQFEDLSLVRRQVRGRGEHIFGGVLTQMVYFEKGKVTSTEKALSILRDNAAILGNTLTPANHEAISRLPHAIAPLFIVGLGLLITQARRPAALFIFLLCLTSYAAPLIAIPIYENRLLMFHISQALVLGYLWQILFAVFRGSLGLFGSGLALCGLIATCVTAILPVTITFFRATNPLAELRDKIKEDTTPKIAYVCTEHETAGNFLRWNPPFLGRDSNATHPLVIFRPENLVDIQELVEFLNVPSLLICKDSVSPSAISSNRWQVESAPRPFWWRTFQTSETADFFVHAIDPQALTETDNVKAHILSYFSPRLIVFPIPSDGVKVQFSSSTRYSKFAVLARGVRGKALPISLTVDDQHLEPHFTKDSGLSNRVLWFSGANLQSGEHTVSVTVTQEANNWDKVLEDIIVIGIP